MTVTDSTDATMPAPEAFSGTTLGPTSAWPPQLRSAFDVCLQSSVPAFVWWGPRLIQLYNAASAPLLRAGNASLGMPAREAWADAWPVIGPVVERVLQSGSAGVARAVAVAQGDAESPSHVDLYYNAIQGERGGGAGLYAIAVQSMDGAKHASLHQRMLAAAVRLTGSDFASLQLLDRQREELQLIAHRGFPADAAAFWDRVGADSGTTCGKALERKQRIVVPDVEEAPFIRGTIDLRVFRDAGIRAVQSTPLVARDRRLIGMMSTHWRRSHRPEPVELERFDLLARHVTDVLARDI